MWGGSSVRRGPGVRAAGRCLQDMCGEVDGLWSQERAQEGPAEDGLGLFQIRSRLSSKSLVKLYISCG